MSRVKRLSIRGIRNFDDSHEAQIKFERPLTLIVGQNGVGKTTIIECLRYISTGEFPPGSDRGKSFIHDPMLKKLKSVEIRGVVKAEFTDRRGERFTVTRTIGATRYDKKVSFKTIDNSISRINPRTKEEIGLTHRCGDMDQETTNLLGVSKAILNNVIFCHQDDANWPLDDSKKLKERFDDIFDTVRYNKALELIRKQMKARQNDIKLLVQQKKYFSDKVSQVDKKERELTSLEDQKQVAVGKIKRLENTLKPKQDRLEEISAIEKEYEELHVKEQTQKVEYNMRNQSINKLQVTITDLFMGSDEELKYEIGEDDKVLALTNQDIDRIKSAIDGLMREEKQLSIKLSQQLESLGKLRHQLDDQDRLVKQRNQHLNSVLSTWNLESVDVNSEENVSSGIKKIEGKMSDFEKSVRDKRTLQTEKESKLEKKVDGLRNEHTKIDCELRRNEEEVINIRETIGNARVKISQADGAAKKLDTVDKKLQAINKRIKQINDNIELENLAEKIKKETENLKLFQDEHEQLNEEMSIMQKQNTENIKLDNLKSDLKKKEKTIDEFRSKHEKTICEILGVEKIPEMKLKQSLDDVRVTLTERLEKINKEIQSKEVEIGVLSASIKTSKNDLKTKIAEINIEKEKINPHCSDYNSFDEVLNRQSKIVSRLRNKKGMFSYQKSAFSEYKKKLEEDDPCCPLCDRDFKNSFEVGALIKKMSDALKLQPEQLIEIERDLKIAEDKQQLLISLKSPIEKVLKFEDKIKAELYEAIKEKEKNLRDKQENISELKELIKGPQKNLQTLQTMQSDVIIWDKCTCELMNIELSIDEMEEELSAMGQKATKTMDEIKTEQSILHKNIKTLRGKIDSMQNKKQHNDDDLKEMSSKRAACLEEQLSIHKEVQDLKQLKENLIEWTEKEALLKTSIKDSKELLSLAKNKLNTAKNELEIMKNEHSDEQDMDRKMTVEYSKEIDKLKSIQESLCHLLDQKIDLQLNATEKKKNELETLVQEKKGQKIKKEKELTKIKEDISSRENRKRNLTDNLTLRTEVKKLEILKTEIREITKKISALNYKDVMSESQELKIETQRIEKEINQAKGTKDVLEKGIIEINSDLKMSEYADARKDFSNKCIELTVAEMSNNDLKTYVTALDSAMTVYHEERMNTVNRTMKKLWEYIYTGTDTTSIQIRTEASSGTEKKRTFNYKLVQIKHGIEMDMKGRCSAGQRVLASIIMRLALAETFCDQCGILALDEPTTNLDEDNSKSLAETLYKYVELRSKHRSSFQLIIITHDENFIQKLSQLSNHNCAYELYRQEENGLTSIRYLQMEHAEIKGRDSDDDDDDDDDETTGDNSKGKKTRGRDDDDDDDSQQPGPGSSRKKINTGSTVTKKKTAVKFGTDF